MRYELSIKSVSVIGVLVAVEVILSRFLSIHTWNLKIGFSFIPIVAAAMLFGILEAGLVGAIGDIIGAVLFPAGTYFPGFTLTAFLNGVLFALFLKKKVTLVRITAAVLLVQMLGSLLLNTVWISVLYQSPFWPLFMTRIYQTFAMTIVQIVSIWILNKKLVPMMKCIL